jgi:peptidoglycan-associated lipoprotein
MTRSPFRGPQRNLLLTALILATTMAACASKPPAQAPDPVPSLDVAPPSAPGTAPDVTPVVLQQQDSSAALSEEERAARAALEREGMVVYFEYDSSQVRPEFLPLLASHARFANRFRDTSLRLEGHADERGSREYNIGLGERRAQTVRNALQLDGVAATQITTVSYGEERPAATGSDEGSWSRNRRVEISHVR